MKTSLPVISNVSTSSILDQRSSILPADEQVLPTLNADGTRRWLNPRLSPGRYWHRRRILAYSLIAFFVTLPHLRFAGKPIVLMDIASRQFTLLGHTFYPQDSPLVALLVLTAILTIMFLTAVAGRVWCGWACPQTVYLEFLFRPIDRFFAGLGKNSPTSGRLFQILRVATYVVCSMFLAHTFLSYFVATDVLAVWMQSSPWKHPVAFLIMSGATVGVLFNFIFFREQFCMVACPYGRFQSVMLDRNSWVVAYDVARGEPRHKGKAIEGGPAGDCIDCGHCTVVCPTGIDIRKGLQMECIHCTQCIDACNAVMSRLDKPAGLIRYASQHSMAGIQGSWIRARTVIYSIGMLLAMALFGLLLSTKFAFDARIMRAPGAPFTVMGIQEVQNNFKIRIVNRSQTRQEYTLHATDGTSVATWSNAEVPALEPGDSQLIPIEIRFPVQRTARRGEADSYIKLTDGIGNERLLHVRLLGPQ